MANLGEWKELFKEDLDLKRGGFGRGGLAKFLKEYAEAFQLPLGTVRTYYYKLIEEETKLSENQVAAPADQGDEVEAPTPPVGPVGEPKKSVDECVAEAANASTVAIRTPETRPKRPPYKHGEEISVKVIDLAEYGVFVKTNDGYGYDGLIHVSEVNPGKYTDGEDLSKLFEVGDEFKVKLKQIKPNGKLELSMKGMTLPSRLNVYTGAEGADHTHKEEKFRNNAMEEKLLGAKHSITLTNSVQQQQTPPPKVVVDPAAQYADVIGFVEEFLGASLSGAAKQKVVELAGNVGTFKLGMFMNQSISEFKPMDIGMQFLGIVESKVTGGL